MKTQETFTPNRDASSPGAPIRGPEPIPSAGASLDPKEWIHIGKTVVPLEKNPEGVAEIFTMTLGSETIQLLPLKTWSQLDVFKWRVRGILPGTPVGLEIAPGHIKIAGETVLTADPDACAKVEKIVNTWLALEKAAFESANRKAQPQRSAAEPPEPQEDVPHFKVETDNAGKPRLRCVEGKETVKIVAVNGQGFNALIEQNLLRKPQSLKVGALHNWVELDGALVRFEEGTGWKKELEHLLNEHYLPIPQPGAPPDIVASKNPASPTGFDIQFPATPNGIAENRKFHLNEESVELLSDPQRCRVLRKDIIAKLTPPQLIFKQKLADGGERYLDSLAENMVTTQDDEGQLKTIALSRPVDLLKISARELTAVLNHPALNRRAHLAQASSPLSQST